MDFQQSKKLPTFGFIYLKKKTAILARIGAHSLSAIFRAKGKDSQNLPKTARGTEGRTFAHFCGKLSLQTVNLCVCTQCCDLEDML